MEFYATWVYRYIFNNEWLLWAFVATILALNLLSPIFIWMIMNGKSVTKFLKKLIGMKKKQSEPSKSS